MKDFFAGKKTRLLTDENEIRGLKLWRVALEEREAAHMACRLEEGATFLYVLDGSLHCQVNQEEMELKAGESLFINSRNAYRFTKCGKDGVEGYVIVMEEAYVSGDEALQEKYITPIRKEEAFSCLKLEKEEAGKWPLRALGETAEEKGAGYELALKSLALKLWLELYKEFLSLKPTAKKAVLREKARLCEMLSYIHANYQSKLTLGELAESCGVSTGEYCRFFKKRMNQTPFEYLQTYRIERCLPELLEKSDSTTNIAVRHGFTGSSYFSETFRKEMGCAPGDYRKWYKGLTEECPLKWTEDAAVPEKTEENTETKAEPEERKVSVRRESMPTFML